MRTWFLVTAMAATAGAALVALDPVMAHASAADGQAVAYSNCAYCHKVAPDQNFVPPMHPPGPDFMTIAASPKWSESRLRSFLFTTHRKEVNIPSGQVSDVVSYIASLKKKKK